MIQDRGQKAQVIRYILAKRWFPQLEVVVLPEMKISKANKALTDIDVLALLPDEFDGFRSLLIDCRTTKGESPISRALWQRGLMDQLRATRGICILKRDNIEDDHRYAGAKLGVLLLTETEFDDFARTTGGADLGPKSSIANLDLWEEYLALQEKFPALKGLVDLAFSGHWMCQTPAEACRKSVALLRSHRGELDPSKPPHIFLVGDSCSLFMESVARITADIFASYLKPAQRDKLSQALLFLLYGGKEAYQYRERILKLVKQPKKGANLLSATEPTKVPELSPPEWNQFVELIRNCLESPTEAPKAPLILRELSFGALSGASRHDFGKTLSKESPHGTKLAIFGIEYLCKAAMLPSEFAEHFVRILMDLPNP